MKSLIKIQVLFITLIVVLINTPSFAIPAYPFPVKVTQPDGSVITIRIYGDEFLNWITCGNRFVEKGEDGYYYYSRYSADGKKNISNVRVSNTQYVMSLSPDVFPPATAFERAKIKRKEVYRNFSNRSIFTSSFQKKVDRIQDASKSLSIGNKKSLVILVQFSNSTFASQTARSNFDNMLNLNGYSANSATGSVWNYFNDNSRGVFNPDFDVIGPVTLSKSSSYYGSNDENGDDMYPREMVAEAIRLADISLNVDFSQYDQDGNGTIDNIFVFYTGYSESSGGGSSTIWPHSWSISNMNVVVDGVRAGSYACASELKGISGSLMDGIGTFCHEYGHVIGLPDFYDTDYSENGQGQGLGAFSLMDLGNYNNSKNTPPSITAIERYLLGWMDFPAKLISSGTYVLQAVSSNVAYYTPTGNDGEFFLYEFRPKLGWDSYIPASGMLIYHIDQSDNDVHGNSAKDLWNYTNSINAYADHQCCDLVEAVYPESAITDYRQIPFPGSTSKRSFTATTSPAAKEWSGYSTGYDITGITESSNSVSFNLSIDKSVQISGKVIDSEGRPLQGASVKLTRLSGSLVSNTRNLAPGISILTSPMKITAETTIVTTNAAGQYSFSKDPGGNFRIEVSKLGYNESYKEFSTSSKVTTLNFTLYTALENSMVSLKKHGSYSSGVGYGTPGRTIYGAVGFSSAELVNYTGWAVKSLSFIVRGNSATQIGVFIILGNECVLSRVVSQPLFETMMTIDVSDAGIVLPANKTVKFGYYVIGSNNGYPLAIDGGPLVPLGVYASATMESLAPIDLDCNIIVSAKILNEDNLFFNLGYNVISSPKTKYIIGESFTLKLETGENRTNNPAPDSIKWFFDNAEKRDGEVITLTKGSHTVKAILYFGDKTETIVQEIQVI